MLVFVDESGDPGFKFASGSSIFFIVAAAIFPYSFSADACDRSIEELRRTLRLPFPMSFTSAIVLIVSGESFLRRS